MLAISLGLIVLIHGFGHGLFLMPMLGLTEWGQSTDSWLIHSATTSKVLGDALWFGAIALFTVAAIQLFGIQSAWRTTAAAASVISLVGITMFWDGSNNASSTFAATVDIVLLLLIVLAAGPSARIIGI